jgi:hypothetical protein
MPPMPLDTAHGQTLDNTVGAVYLGVVGASMYVLSLENTFVLQLSVWMISSLFGVSSLQTYWYYHQYPRDSLLHKISVSLLVIFG